MTRAWRYIKIPLVITAIYLSAAACTPKLVDRNTPLPALYSVSGQSARYDFDITFGKTGQGGILVTKKYDDKVRIVCTSYFGMSIFDLSLTPDSYTLNSCIEPLQKKNIWEMLSKDLRLIFMPVPAGKYSTDKEGNQILKSGKGIAYGKISYSPDSQTTIIRHPWLKLQLTLKPTTTQNRQ